MDEFITCSMNCQNKPIYVCKSDKKTFLCFNHAALHGELESAEKHLFIRIKKNPDPQTKIIISKFIKGLKLQTIQDRLKVIKESSLLIKQLIEVTASSLDKLALIEKKLDKYLCLCDTLIPSVVKQYLLINNSWN